jgi:hypothetical protein
MLLASLSSNNELLALNYSVERSLHLRYAYGGIVLTRVRCIYDVDIGFVNHVGLQDTSQPRRDYLAAYVTALLAHTTAHYLHSLDATARPRSEILTR